MSLLDQAYGRITEDSPDVLRLDGNEGAVPAILSSLAGFDPRKARDYPDLRELEAGLADLVGVDVSRIAVTAGADDALDRCFRAFASGGSVALPVPTFVMLYRFAAMTGADVVAVNWGDTFPLKEMTGAVSQGSLAMVTSPNNPDGKVITLPQLRALSQASGSRPVILDHVYVEYADEDLTREALKLGNVIVVRTLSKAWGLAGCRIGYAVGPPALIQRIRAFGNPFPVAAPSAAIAVDMLRRGTSELETHVNTVVGHRERLSRRIRELGAKVVPSQGNFVWMEAGLPARVLFSALRNQGVLVRYFADRPELAGGVRVTVPVEDADMDRLGEALRTVLRPPAILFDLDGVLADVRASYRACIEQTAQAFGVALSPEAVARAKQTPDSNNDWRVTHRLIEDAGKTVSLEAVTREFQSRYAVLRERETPLMTPDVWRDLKDVARLAVVTGRPRAEAEWFLRRHDLEPECLVAMEDAPAKPDPAPVRLALERLGVKGGWMIGDTPDDMVAAASAGVVPLGVVPPGEDALTWSESLARAGACEVLDTVNGMKGWLS